VKKLQKKGNSIAKSVIHARGENTKRGETIAAESDFKESKG